MNNKHRKILENIFVDPLSPSIPWADIEGAFWDTTGSSRKGDFIDLIRSLVTDKGAVKSVRRFFVNIGLKP